MKRMIMKPLVSLICTMTIFIACQTHNEPGIQQQPSPGKYDFATDSSFYSNEMKRYWLVLLKKGDNRTQDSVSAERIQQAHMANIDRLARQGKIIMAGPIGAEGDLRGIFIMDAKDSTEVAALVNTDTTVITGRLKIEYYPWWSAKGKFIFK